MLQVANGEKQMDKNRNGQGISTPREHESLVEPERSSYSNQALLRMARAGGISLVTPVRPSQGTVLQRKCACGSSAGLGGECEACKKKQLQAKLTIGASNDPLEQEADQVAEQVMRMPAPISQKKDANSSEDFLLSSPASEIEPQLQCLSESSQGSIEVASDLTNHLGTGVPLDTSSRTYFEPRFRYDFGNVRIHTGTQANETATSIHARAFTLGHDVVFAEGEHDPQSESGKHLLAHELTHVIQQGAGRHSSDSVIIEGNTPSQTTVQRDKEPAPMPAPTTAAPAPCLLPTLLGTGRTGHCGNVADDDFKNCDLPTISSASESKLAVWAAAKNLRSGSLSKDRSLVSDTDCLSEMDSVLTFLAGSAGHSAFTQFSAGTGSTVSHGPGSTLGSQALASPEFAATVATTKKDIEADLAAQAPSGTLDPCTFPSPVVPPQTHFAYRHFYTPGPLKAVIGGTHGETLFATAFTGDIASRTYSIGLRYLICDNFGVDETDLYAPGLFPFWVLQHERCVQGHYAPFVNELDLPITVSGTF